MIDLVIAIGFVIPEHMGIYVVDFELAFVGITATPENG